MKCGVENQKVSKGSNFSIENLLILFATIIVIGTVGRNYYMKQTTAYSLSIKPVNNAIVNKDEATFTKDFGSEKVGAGKMQELMDYINESEY